MGAGASIDNTFPDRMTLSQVEDAAGFQARLLGKVKERFEAIATIDKTISKEQFIIGITNGLEGKPGEDRSPDELITYKQEQIEKAILQEKEAQIVAVEKAAAKAASVKEAVLKKRAADAKAANPSKYDMSQFKIKAYDPEEIKKRLAEQEKRTKKKEAMLAMDPNKAANEKQRDKILRVQAREQEKISDLNSRIGLTNLKDQRSRMSIEDKKATQTAMTCVSYDAEIGNNAVDGTIIETCSCLQGEACLDVDNCLDWVNRHAVAKAYGMGFGKSKTGIHFSSGDPLVKVFGESSETLTVNGKVLGR